MNISEIQKKHDQLWAFNKTTIIDLYKIVDGIVSGIDDNVIEQSIEQGLVRIDFYKSPNPPNQLDVILIISNGTNFHAFTIEKS